jgi:hypothetical protein
VALQNAANGLPPEEPDNEAEKEPGEEGAWGDGSAARQSLGARKQLAPWRPWKDLARTWAPLLAQSAARTVPPTVPHDTHVRPQVSRPPPPPPAR